MEPIFWILIAAGVLFAAVTAAIAIYLVVPQPYPSLTESDYTHHTTPWWQIYYCHKYLRPKRRAERGAGLEQYFQSLDFHFETSDIKDPQPLTIAAVGDLMCRKEFAGSGSDCLFHEVADEIFQSDLSVGNLEFAVNPHTYWYKLLRFSVPASYASPLLGTKDRGRFDAVSLANNHINDSFHEGIRETCAFLDKEQTAYTGANPTETDQDRILMLERGGIKIAILSYTFSTNNIPLEKGREWGTNVVRFNALSDDDYCSDLIERHIALAKEQGANYIVSCHHWCIDLELFPPSRIVRRAHALLDAGIDLILGHHPHVLGPVDRYKTQDGRDALVFFSLGNLTAKGLPFAVQRLAAAARISLVVGTDAEGRKVVRPSSVEMIPTLFSSRRINGVRSGIIRRVKRDALSTSEPLLPLSFRERAELRQVERLFQKYFQSETNGIRYR